MKLLIVWLVNAVALMAVAYLVPGIAVSDFVTALIAALVLGLVNAVIRPILILMTLPATLLTLGLFGAIAYSIVSWLLSALLLPARKAG